MSYKEQGKEQKYIVHNLLEATYFFIEPRMASYTPTRLQNKCSLQKNVTFTKTKTQKHKIKTITIKKNINRSNLGVY